MVKKELLQNFYKDMSFYNLALENALLFIDRIKSTKDLTGLDDIYFLILRLSNKIDRYSELLKVKKHG